MILTGIYKIINRSNGKYYVGSTKNSKIRWSDHKEALNKSKHYNVHLQRAWNKYGGNSFEFTLVEECSSDKLLLIEQHYLDICKQEPSRSYNQIYTAGGGGGFSEETLLKMRRPRPSMQGKNNPRYGTHHSDITKSKISIKNKIYYSNPLNRTMLGKHHTEGSRQKISLSRKGKYGGENSPMFGKHLSEETKKKIGDANRGKIFSEEHKKKIGAKSVGRTPMLGKHLSEETKRKLSILRKGKYCGKDNPMYGKTFSPETIKKMSEQRRGKLFDKNFYTLRNIYTNEIITNTKYYFVQERGLYRSHICKLLRGELKRHKGWELYNPSL